MIGYIIILHGYEYQKLQIILGTIDLRGEDMVYNSNKSYLEKKIEEKRNELHNLLDFGGLEEIIEFSQELDLLINDYNKEAMEVERNS